MEKLIPRLYLLSQELSIHHEYIYMASDIDRDFFISLLLSYIGKHEIIAGFFSCWYLIEIRL